MSTEKRLALATRLAALYSQATDQSVNPVALMNNRDEYNRIVEHALTLDERELVAAALDCADTEGFLCAVYWYSGRGIAPSSSLNEAQWVVLKNAAINVAGPIGVFVVQRVRDEGKGTDWGSAVGAISDALGSVGGSFKKEVASVSVVEKGQ